MKLVKVCASFCSGKVSYRVVASLVVLHRHGAVPLPLNGDEELQGRLQRNVDLDLDQAVFLPICISTSSDVLFRDLVLVDSERCDVVHSLDVVNCEHSDYLMIYLMLGITWRLIFITRQKFD
jgi:hypothetical protein